MFELFSRKLYFHIFHRLSPGVDVELQPEQSSIRLVQVALESCNAGPVNIYLDDVLLCRLSSAKPQVNLCILVSHTSTLRSEGSQSASVHIVAECRSDPFVVVSPKRVVANKQMVEATKHIEATYRAAGAKQLESGPPTTRSILSPKRPRANAVASSKPKPTRVPRLRWGEDVLVAEYVPKMGGPTIGIYPERRRMSLDEMEAAQEARRLAEEEEGSGEEEEDSDDDEGGEAGQLIKMLGDPNSSASSSTVEWMQRRLATLIANEMGGGAAAPAPAAAATAVAPPAAKGPVDKQDRLAALIASEISGGALAASPAKGASDQAATRAGKEGAAPELALLGSLARHLLTARHALLKNRNQLRCAEAFHAFGKAVDKALRSKPALSAILTPLQDRAEQHLHEQAPCIATIISNYLFNSAIT